MRITRHCLRRIIQEEMTKIILQEGWQPIDPYYLEDVLEEPDALVYSVQEHLNVPVEQLITVTTEDDDGSMYQELIDQIELGREIPGWGVWASEGTLPDGTQVVVTNEYGMGTIWARSLEVLRYQDPNIPDKQSLDIY